MENRRGLGSLGNPQGISISPAAWAEVPVPIPAPVPVPEPKVETRTIIQKIKEYVTREVKVEVPVEVQKVKVVSVRVSLAEYPVKKLLGEIWRRFLGVLMRRE